VHIRPAFRLDLHECLDFTSSFQTERVWQLEQREEEIGITVSLRSVRLPRPMEVEYPPVGWPALRQWEQAGSVLVAEVQGQVSGYVGLASQPDQQLCWIQSLVVDRPRRGQGIGTALAQSAAAWAKNHALKQLMVAVQSKNHPGVQFCRHLGFCFCGFNDRFFANRDIALFFAGRVQ
jgi:GNAT superfamily N-acetyltransferase